MTATIKSETAVSREKAKAILFHAGMADDFLRLDGADFYLATDDEGNEHLMLGGSEEPLATADTDDTSWYSPGYPPLPSTYVVCGREPEGPWETAIDDLDSFGDGEAWLRSNFGRFSQYAAWYVDRADNDGHAESYWSVRDGDLIHTN